MTEDRTLALLNASNRGTLKLPLDWKRCHPSLPRQMERHFDSINAHPIITKANILPTVWVEFDRSK